MQVELGHAAQILTFDELMEIDLERAFQSVLGTEKCSVAFVANAHVLEQVGAELQIGVHVVEDQSERRHHPVTATFGSLQ